MIKEFFKSHPIHKQIVIKFDTLFLLRPTLFFPVWIMLCAGMAVGTMTVDRYLIWRTDLDYKVFFVFLGITLISGAAFIINQIYDREGDQINRKLFLIGDHISPEIAEFRYKLIAGVGFFFLLMAGLKPLIYGVALFVFWGIFYNFKPFQFKQKAVLGMLINTIAGLTIFLTGWCIVDSDNFAFSRFIFFVKYSFPYLLCFTAVSLLTTLPDMKGDRKTGSKTFPIKFGRLPTMILATLCVILASYLGYVWDDPVTSTAGLVSTPFFIWMLMRRKPIDVLRTIRFSILNLALFLMIVYPYLFVASFINFYLSKYYYWHRFNLHYPTMLVDD